MGPMQLHHHLLGLKKSLHLHLNNGNSVQRTLHSGHIKLLANLQIYLAFVHSTSFHKEFQREVPLCVLVLETVMFSPFSSHMNCYPSFRPSSVKFYQNFPMPPSLDIYFYNNTYFYHFFIQLILLYGPSISMTSGFYRVVNIFLYNELMFVGLIIEINVLFPNKVF